MTTITLFCFFAPLSLVILGNAFMVKDHNKFMRISLAVLGLSFAGLSAYWLARHWGIIQTDSQATDIARYMLIGAAVGMYSVFGTPLFLELTKRGKR